MALSEDDLQRIEEEERARFAIRRRIEAERPSQVSAGSAVAGLASFFIPGLGQVIQGRIGQGVLFFFALLVCAVFVSLFGPLLGLLSWVTGAVFAAVDAAKWVPGASEGIRSDDAPIEPVEREPQAPTSPALWLLAVVVFVAAVYFTLLLQGVY